ncbi:MAG: lysyl oxidase family protein [Chloroflexota bacterium]
MRLPRSLAAVAAAVFAATGLVAAPAGAATPSLLLPDLRVRAPSELIVCGSPTSGPFMDQDCPPAKPGDRLLRFTSILLNVGAGPFTLHSSRPSTAVPKMTAEQLIQRAAGGDPLVVPTGAHVHWGLADDGHPHWHTEDVERYRLFRVSRRLSEGARVGVKRGYCFLDDIHPSPTMPGSPPDEVYHFNSCGVIGDPAAQDLLEITTGLSVGWGDRYGATYAGQWVSLDRLGDGQYLLCVTADPEGHFRERREDNNEGWVRLRVRTTGSGVNYRVAVTVLAQAQTGCQSQLSYRIAPLPPRPGAVTSAAFAEAAPSDPVVSSAAASVASGSVPVAAGPTLPDADRPALFCLIARATA